MNCTVCRTRNTITDYSITTVTKHKRTKEVYCKECLTDIAKKSNVWSHKNNIPKLRDTKIDKYNETINDYRFIPIAFRMKINQQTGEVITFNERGIKPDYSLYNNDK